MPPSGSKPSLLSRMSWREKAHSSIALRRTSSRSSRARVPSWPSAMRMRASSRYVYLARGGGRAGSEGSRNISEKETVRGGSARGARGAHAMETVSRSELSMLPISLRPS